MIRRATPPTPARYAVADAVGLLVFVVLGLRFHYLPIEAEAVLRTALPLWATWFLVAAILRTYAKRSWKVFLLNWAVAVPAGLVLRQVLLGRDLDHATLVFVAWGMAATLILLVAARAVTFLLLRGR